eukprot:TRINITY_DN37129_c0_g1_i5.p2 TRINITY_DN37129_c0_g1~~TRINITY_DN37129_c0_g1_i5.p2  ORF type:complete len:187 (-),score=21.04 TRINITY_DN37129_c0_g1_i5:285-845(-)
MLDQSLKMKYYYRSLFGLLYLYDKAKLEASNLYSSIICPYLILFCGELLQKLFSQSEFFDGHELANRIFGQSDFELLTSNQQKREEDFARLGIQLVRVNLGQIELICRLECEMVRSFAELELSDYFLTLATQQKCQLGEEVVKCLKYFQDRFQNTQYKSFDGGYLENKMRKLKTKINYVMQQHNAN